MPDQPTTDTASASLMPAPACHHGRIPIFALPPLPAQRAAETSQERPA
ncbi:hypothetical protein ACXN5S_15900 [Pseudoroseicyclus sp. H15]